jgi:hypothetical protein
MNLMGNDNVATQSGANVLVAGKMLFDFLETTVHLQKFWGEFSHPHWDAAEPGWVLCKGFKALDECDVPRILRLHLSPLHVLLDHVKDGWDVVDSAPRPQREVYEDAREEAEENRETEKANLHRAQVVKIFDAIQYLKAPENPTNGRQGYTDELKELHALSQNQYDGIVENLCSSAESALKEWARAAPEQLPRLAEAEHWAVGARRVSGTSALIRSALALVERVALECGRNRGRVVGAVGRRISTQELTTTSASRSKSLEWYR